MADDLMEMEATDLGAADTTEDAEQGEDLEGTESGEENEQDSDEQSEEGDESENETEEEQQEEEKPEEVAAQDGRKLPDFAKKGIAALKNSNPEAAKYFRAVHFQNADYKAAVGTPADAIALKNQWEEIGGADGVAMIQEERQEWANVDRLAGEGKAAELVKDNPELLAKNAVGFINEWANNPQTREQYGYFANKVTVGTLQATGIPDELAACYEQLGAFAKQNPDLAPYLQPFQTKIAGAYNKIVDLNENSMQYEQKRTDPREDQLKQKETAFEEKRRADFETQVATEAETYRDQAIDKAINALLNGRKADDDQMKHYRKLVRDEVDSRLAATPNFDASLEAHYRTGDRGKSVGYVKQQFDRILNMGKAADVIAPLLRNINPTKAPVAKTQNGKPASKGAGEPGLVNLSDAPAWDQVDFTNDPQGIAYAQGRATLKNGKQARW